MGSLGFTEMLLIAGVALLVIGPERFPDFAKIVLRTVRDLRGYVDEVKVDLAKELNPLKGEFQKFSNLRDPRNLIDLIPDDDDDDDDVIDTNADSADDVSPDEYINYKSRSPYKYVPDVNPPSDKGTEVDAEQDPSPGSDSVKDDEDVSST